MSIYLNEMQAGWDRAVIGFPHLLLCMGFVLQTNANLYGYHFDSPTATGQSAGALLAFIRERGGDPSTAVAIYGSCNWNARYRDAKNGKKAWQAEMTSIAGTLGYHGVARGFDTSIIPAADGHYVEYHPEYVQKRCRIFYKAHDNTDFGSQLLTADVARTQTRGNVATFKPQDGSPVANLVTGTRRIGLTTTSTAAGLTEVDYRLRLIEFSI